MSAAVCEPGAERGAGSAEVRKPKRGAGSWAVGECGRSAEEVRNLSLPPVPAPLATRPAPPGRGPAPSLVRVRGRIQREELPAAAPPPGGEPAAPGAVSYVAARYGFTRHWCVMHGPELVAVVAYRKGAAELVRRLNASGTGLSCGVEVAR